MKAPDLKKWAEDTITAFILSSPENNLQNAENEKAWAEPLVGFANGADPLFEAYKDHVGPFHFTPLEIFNRTFPGISTQAEDLTVISWILPQSDKTKSDNRRETQYPSERWARARIIGEKVNATLRSHVVATLEAAGYAAVAPQLSPFWERKESPKYGFASCWSERHAAYAAGLGTFGLSDGLITPRGKAMRCGSVAANIRIPVPARPYQDHHAYCLFYPKGKCGKCIGRCPAGAISEKGHDKIACRKYIREVTAVYVKTKLHMEGYACGLCQTGVPCESKIPALSDIN
ncbi:MAG: epoxyqueuosine reductase [Desulfobacterales bacterium]|nr:epoxyqueuosine reductase [Desulfobacterales bacterium]